MLQTTTATRGIVTVPHHLAAEAGIDVLREGGNAIEAMVATVATIAAVYPHMNGIGGDGFWLIHLPGAAPVGIETCGATGARVNADLYRSRGVHCGAAPRAAGCWVAPGARNPPR